MMYASLRDRVLSFMHIYIYIHVYSHVDHSLNSVYNIVNLHITK